MTGVQTCALPICDPDVAAKVWEIVREQHCAWHRPTANDLVQTLLHEAEIRLLLSLKSREEELGIVRRFHEKMILADGETRHGDASDEERADIEAYNRLFDGLESPPVLTLPETAASRAAKAAKPVAAPQRIPQASDYDKRLREAAAAEAAAARRVLGAV